MNNYGKITARRSHEIRWSYSQVCGMLLYEITER